MSKVFNKRMSSQEAQKLAEAATKAELESLNKEIKEQHKNNMKSTDDDPSDFDFDVSSDDDSASSEDTPKIGKSKYTVMSMQDRMYVDNQTLWKKNKNLQMLNDKLENKIHYIQLDYNNCRIELSETKGKLKEYKLAHQNVRFMKKLLIIYTLLIGCFVFEKLTSVSLVDLVIICAYNLFVYFINIIQNVYLDSFQTITKYYLKVAA